MAYIARKTAEGAEKARQGGTAKNGTNHVSETSPQEAWPVDEQQDWPDKGWGQGFDTSSGGLDAERGGKSKW